MSSSRSHKKQHYVPASYLKAWVDPHCPKGQEPYVWVFPKSGGTGRRRAPRNLFVETDFYTALDADGERDLQLEHGLAGLESHFARLANRLNREGAEAVLDDRDRGVVDTMVASLHARTVSQVEHWRREWGGVDAMMTKMRDAVDRMSPEEKQRLALQAGLSDGDEDGLTQDDIRHILRSPQQELMVPHIIAMLPALASMDVVLLYTEDSLGFITSDAPVVIGDPQIDVGGILGVSFMSPSVEVYFPVSPAHCLVMHRGGVAGVKAADRPIVDEVNRSIRFSCDQSFVVRRAETNPYWFAEIPRS